MLFDLGYLRYPASTLLELPASDEQCNTRSRSTGTESVAGTIDKAHTEKSEIVETVAPSHPSMVASLNNLRRTPLDRIRVTQAEAVRDVVEQVMSQQGAAHGAVGVARFGSSI